MEFEEIYIKYKDDVFRFINKLCNYQSDVADDITQETFLKAYINLWQYKGNSSVKTWLFSIAKNTFFAEIRKKKIDTISIEELELFDRREKTDVQVQDKELLERILEIIFSFQENMKEVFLSRVYSGDSYTKISKDLGISESSAKVLVFRGRKIIKKKLEEEYHYEI